MCLPEQEIEKALVVKRKKFLYFQQFWDYESGFMHELGLPRYFDKSLDQIEEREESLNQIEERDQSLDRIEEREKPLDQIEEREKFFDRIERLDALNHDMFDALGDLYSESLKLRIDYRRTFFQFIEGIRFPRDYMRVMDDRAFLIYIARYAARKDPSCPRAAGLEAGYWNTLGSFLADSLEGGNASIERMLVEYDKSVADTLGILTKFGFSQSEIEANAYKAIKDDLLKSGFGKGSNAIDSIFSGYSEVLKLFRRDMDSDAYGNTSTGSTVIFRPVFYLAGHGKGKGREGKERG